MENKKMVSVIMCVYNTPQDYLNEAVLSILNQTYKEFELIIVDDNSDQNLFNDGLFKDRRITILHNDKNYGPSYSRNRALDIAKGKYIAIMDSDDISLPTRLIEQVEFLETNPNVVACGTWFQFFGIKKHEVKRTIDNNEYYRCCLLFDNAPTILNPSVMIRRSVLIDNNIIWNNELRIGEDYLMWIQLSEHGIITNLKKILLFYRTHKNQTTAKNHCVDNHIIKKYLFNSIGIEDSDANANLLNTKKITKLKTIKEIDALLKNIITANSISNYYNDCELKIRCDEQIENLIRTIKNPFLLLQLILLKRFRKISKKVLKDKVKKMFRKNNNG